MHELKCLLEAELGKAKLKGIDNVNAKELGEVIDMYKDICEIEHMKCEKEYWEVKKMKYWLEICAMQDEMQEGEDKRYYRGQPRNSKGQYMRGGRRMYEPDYRMTPEMYRDMDMENMTDKEKRDMDKHMGRMYYTEPDRVGNNSSNMRDGKEGRSGMSRRTYMETKDMHRNNTPEDKQKKMQSLDSYMMELASDVTEMIEDATPEERTLLKQKLANLSNKV